MHQQHGCKNEQVDCVIRRQTGQQQLQAAVQDVADGHGSDLGSHGFIFSGCDFGRLGGFTSPGSQLEFGKEGLPAHDGDYPLRFATVQVKCASAVRFCRVAKRGILFYNGWITAIFGVTEGNAAPGAMCPGVP